MLSVLLWRKRVALKGVNVRRGTHDGGFAKYRGEFA